MSHDHATPFATLTPDALLDAIDSLGLHTDGRISALNSFENRVYQVGIEDAPPLIAKFYRPERWSDDAILEEHAFTTALNAAEIPVVTPLMVQGHSLHHHGDFRFALYPRIRGRAPELSDANALTWMGRFIARTHAIGELAGFRARPTLSIERLGEESQAWIAAHALIPPELVDAWQGTVVRALQGVHACFARTGSVQHLRIHGDCHAGNVMWAEDGPWFVDFDDTCMGPAVQDIWLLLSGHREEMQQQLGAVLRGYEQFRDFDRRELQLVEALRTLRLVHYAAWIARRWHDPAFPVAFPWFGTPRYWQDRILELKEQIAAMDEEPLVPAGLDR